MTEFERKSILVTGGGSGIGIAVALADAGATVTVVGRNKEKLAVVDAVSFANVATGTLDGGCAR